MSETLQVVVHPERHEFTSIIREIAEHGLPQDSEVIYEGRNKVVRINRHNLSLCIKAFKKPNIIQSYVYGSLQRSKADRSYFNAIRLLEMGFHTPAPIGYIEHKKNGRLLESYYICEYIDAKPAYHYECGELFPQISRMLASDLYKMQENGVFMPDFTPGNFIIKDPDNPEKLTIHYVDLNRTRFNVFSTRTHRRALNSPFYLDIHVEKFLKDFADESGRALSDVTSDFLKARESYNRKKRLVHPIKYYRKNAR